MLNNSTKLYKTQESTKQFVEFLKENKTLKTISNQKIKRQDIYNQILYIHAVKCLNCEAEYVGKTTQHIDVRIYQYKMVKDGQHGLTKSHITEHAQKLRHKID